MSTHEPGAQRLKSESGEDVSRAFQPRTRPGLSPRRLLIVDTDPDATLERGPSVHANGSTSKRARGVSHPVIGYGQQSTAPEFSRQQRVAAEVSGTRQEPSQPTAAAAYLIETATRASSVNPRARVSTALVVGSLASIVLGIVCKHEERVEANGVTTGPGASQTVTAAVSGSVDEVYVHSGDEVSAGQQLLTLEANAQRAELAEATENLNLAQKRLDALTAQEPLHELRLGLLRTDESLTQRRLRSDNDALQNVSKLSAVAYGRVELEPLHDQLRNLERDKLTAEQDLTRTQLQAATLQNERSEQLQRARADLEVAQQRSASEVRLAETSLIAPTAGRIERLDAQRGDAVQLGQVFATIVPAAPPTQIVAFIADRSRLRIGAAVQVEVDMLPATFAELTGTLTAIGTRAVSRKEQQLILGEEAAALEPGYRVAVQLDETSANRLRLARVTTGASVATHIHVGERRAIAWLADTFYALFSDAG